MCSDLKHATWKGMLYYEIMILEILVCWIHLSNCILCGAVFWPLQHNFGASGGLATANIFGCCRNCHKYEEQISVLQISQNPSVKNFFRFTCFFFFLSPLSLFFFFWSCLLLLTEEICWLIILCTSVLSLCVSLCVSLSIKIVRCGVFGKSAFRPGCRLGMRSKSQETLMGFQRGTLCSLGPSTPDRDRW